MVRGVLLCRVGHIEEAYDLGALAEPEEEELTDVCYDCGRLDALDVVHLGGVALALPLDLALDLALEVRRVSRRYQRHLDV
jgi:hypothetical protein